MENLISFVQNQIDGVWNSHDINRVLDSFDDNATISMSPPVPGFHSTARGKEEIREFVETLLPGFHVESSKYKVTGDRVTWYSRLEADVFRNMGIESVESNTSAVIRNNKVVSLSPSFTSDSITKLQAASQRVASQGTRPAIGTTRPSPRSRESN